MNAEELARLVARVERLEEHAAFGERGVEELSEEVKVLNERVREMGKKVRGLEMRLEKIGGEGEREEE